ncbi:MAG TPA: hypothetical protein VH878_07905 [Thermodesulfobacteriota bacterium]|jgi:hypothetical protein
MIQIMCVITAEDYWYLNSMKEQNLPVNYYGYTFEVESGGESEGGVGRVRLMVIELINARMAVGFAIPLKMSVDGEFELRFLSHESPTNEIPLVCKLSQEVKRTSYMGDDNAKLEYIGFSLERFYEAKGATFYFYDLRGSNPQS